MAIVEAEFEAERELESWVKGEFSTFLPASVLTDGFLVSTPSGKKGVPDGFAFDFEGRQWYVIECELLKHGVWPHIAEQVTRFVVAMKNPGSLRTVRDRLFEHVMQVGTSDDVARQLGCVPERLLQEIELFVEGIRPHFVIFIDKTNKDLQDMASALDAPTLVYRIQKFLVDGRPEYHSPDRNLPTLMSEPEQSPGGRGPEFDAVEHLGIVSLFPIQSQAKSNGRVHGEGDIFGAEGRTVCPCQVWPDVNGSRACFGITTEGGRKPLGGSRLELRRDAVETGPVSRLGGIIPIIRTRLVV